MNLTEALKNKGKPFEIPDCPRDTLPEFFKQMGFNTGAEIGVYKGAFTEKFCMAGLKMYAIDPWIAHQGVEEQARQDFLYGHTQRTLAPYKNCTIIRSTSMGALKQFKDGGLDFVYIDGDHSFRHIAEDISEWSKKVRSGGIVSGHDYFYSGPKVTRPTSHVEPVVNAYITVMEIESFYVFGQDKYAKDKDDRFLSWMFIKP